MERRGPGMVRLRVDDGSGEERSVCCGRGLSGRGARSVGLLACVCAWPKANPRERSNNSTREWNGLEQAIDGVVSHAEQVVGVCSCNTGRARRRAAAAADVRWQGLP